MTEELAQALSTAIECVQLGMTTEKEDAGRSEQKADDKEKVVTTLQLLQAELDKRVKPVSKALGKKGTITADELRALCPDLFDLEKIVAFNKFLGQIKPSVVQVAFGL
jgi:hypothetical protein